MERDLPKDSGGIRKAVEEIFTMDKGGDAVLQLGKHLGQGVQKVKKSQVRKFLTEIKAIKEYDEFALNRFRWVCLYIMAQERDLELLGEYLRVAAELVPKGDAKDRFKRLQSLMESVYAHYCYSTTMREERTNA